MIWTAGHPLQNGKYIIQTVIGRGFSGIIYEALQAPFDRSVAIKTPKNDPDSEKFVQRLLEEGRLLTYLARDPHPHIVGVRDRFQEGEIHCLVMDFFARRNPVPASETSGGTAGDRCCAIHSADWRRLGRVASFGTNPLRCPTPQHHPES